VIQATRAQRTRTKHSLKSLSGWNEFEAWRGFDSIELCLGVNALALVLNEKLRKLGCLEWWWLGMAVVDGRTGQSGVPPDSPVCHRTLSGAPATSPNC
jgi:hypothetical protein